MKEVQHSFLSWECGLHAVTPSEEQSMKGRERERKEERKRKQEKEGRQNMEEREGDV